MAVCCALARIKQGYQSTCTGIRKLGLDGMAVDSSELLHTFAMKYWDTGSR